MQAREQLKRGPKGKGSRSGVATARAKSSDVCEVLCVDEAAVRRAERALPAPEAVAALAETFKVLGDQTRVRIARALAREELCVCDLATLLGMSQSAVSHSLRALRQLRLVRYRKAGRIAYYRLDDDHIARLVDEGLRHVIESGVDRAGASTPARTA